MKIDHSNLREWQRVRLDIEVSMESEHNFYAGLTDNISAGGIFIATHQSPKVGSWVEVVLRLPGSEETHALQGVVRWIRDFELSSEGNPPGCGIQWYDLPDEVFAAIVEFVKERETIFHDEAAAA